MCGITGFYSFKQEVPYGAIKKMNDALAHRGPDAEGYFQDNYIHLGHRRLSIIDISEASNQPLYDESGQYTIVFNGEIYNYQEIKASLTHYKFKTNGDGEVVLAAFLKHGKACLNLLKGMFAFAIYNKLDGTLFLAKDRLGVKPIYYYNDGINFVFASEIRAILASGIVPKKIDQYALGCYLQMQSFYAPHTIIENVKQLANGNYIEIKNQIFEIGKYWDITKPKTQFRFDNYEEVKLEVKKLMLQSVERRLVADVPVAAFLSGGIDSSAIVGLMSELKDNVDTFNIAFAEKEFDESKYAKIIANKFNTNHHEILLKPNDFLEILPTALNAMDIPSADGVNSYLVSKKIADQGIKVAMSGAGGDELFAGYQGFAIWQKLNKNKILWNTPVALRKLFANVLPNNRKYNRIKRIVSTKELSVDNFQMLMREIIPANIVQSLTGKESYNYEQTNSNSFPLLSQYSIAELLRYTQYTLLKDTDQFSMAVALEVREPFFDSDLIEYVLQVPDIYKSTATPKKLLVDSLGTLLPTEIVNRPKKGFTFPWQIWLQNELRNFCEAKLKNLAERSVLQSKVILQMWNDFLANKNVRWAEIWTLVVLESWLQKNIDN